MARSPFRREPDPESLARTTKPPLDSSFDGHVAKVPTNMIPRAASQSELADGNAQVDTTPNY